MLNNLDKKNGWIDMAIIQMKEKIWDILSFKIKSNKPIEWIYLVGLPTFED